MFRRAGSSRKWLYTHRDGKWCAYYGRDASLARKRFFDHTLKGLDNGWASEPAVRLAISDGGPEPAEIVRESAWPPKDIALRTLRLDAHTGSLLLGSTPQTQATVTFDTRRAKAAFEWTLPTDMDVIGPMALHLFVELRGAADAFLFANVRQIRAGREVTFEGSYGFSGDSVSKGWQRAAHRELDLELSTPLQPVHVHERVEPLRAGEIALVQIALLPHATRFRRGDLLRVEIRGTWAVPRDPFRGQFPAGYERSPKASCTLHTGGVFDAHLLLGTREDASGSSPHSLEHRA